MSNAQEQILDQLGQLSSVQLRLLASLLDDTAGVSEPRSTLAAFVVPRADRSVSDGELKQYLASRLPGHMIPASFVSLSQLPLNANGKLDRHALARIELPAPLDESASERVETPPMSREEEVLIGIWEEVLGQEHIRLDDNFFEVGGDSLLSIRILAKARQAGLLISPEDFIRCQTVAEQAEVAEWTSAEDKELVDAPPRSDEQDSFSLVDLDDEEMKRLSELLGDDDEDG